MMILIPFSLSTITCSGTLPASSSIDTQKGNFSTYTTNRIYRIVYGPVSGVAYSLFSISSPATAVVRKIDSNGNQAWVFAMLGTPIVRSMAVDSAEQYIYFGLYTNPLSIIKINASTGAGLEEQTQ